MAASKNLSPSERKLRAALAGQTGWANTVDRRARAAHASRGLWQKYYDATDPGLPADVRAKMAESAYHAHMKRLTLKSLKARRLRKEAREKLAARALGCGGDSGCRFQHPMEHLQGLTTSPGRLRRKPAGSA